MDEQNAVVIRYGIIQRALTNVRDGRSAPGVYGLLIAFSVAVALSFKASPDAAVMAAAVAGSGLVFWIAHIHSHLVALWIREDSRPSMHDVRLQAAEQLPLLASCLPAALVLTLGDLGLWSATTAVWIIAGMTILLLAGWGIAIARVAHLGITGGLIVTGVNVGMGLLIVLLKVIFSH